MTVRSLSGRGGTGCSSRRSGRDALRLDAKELGQVRLLVTDVVMPGLDGPSLANELCQRRPGLRVLDVSGYAHGALAERTAVAPGFEFLHKPFTPSSLLARVRAVLDLP